jgi:hypothetical protein
MKFRLFVFVAIIQTIVSACGPSQPQLAVKKIAIAEELLAKGDTTKGLLQLDSIAKLYPKALSEARTALQISNRINVSKLMLQRENLAKANLIVDSLIKEFIPEKGEFDKYTNYIYNRQGIDKTWSRSFVQVYLNEKGDLSLTSNYYGGQWLNHTSLLVEGEGLSVKTDSVPLDNVNNHHSEFNGSKWEKVTYRGEQADKVIALIATNPDKKLKSVFKGHSSYVIWLEESDKKAILTAYNLSRALKVKDASKKAIAILEKKVKSEEV